MIKKIKSFFGIPTEYYVFRRYIKHWTSEKLDEMTWEIKEQFALHFVDSFSSKKEAKMHIKNAKLIDEWQEFIILCC